MWIDEMNILRSGRVGAENASGRPTLWVATATGAIVLFAALGLAGCSDGDGAKTDAGGTDDAIAASDAATTDTATDAVAGDPAAQAKLLGVAETEGWQLAGLKDAVQVIRTEGGTPHIYATNRWDLSLVQGFLLARDRFFVLDLGRRLGLGEVAGLLGDDALASDMESRASGMTHVAERILAVVTPEQEEIFDAFAAGVNAYIAQVEAGKLPAPSELDLAAGLLGYKSPAAMMKPFVRRDMAGFAAVVIYNLGYETGDVGRAQTAAQLDSLFAGKPLEALRRKGASDDIWSHVDPVFPVASAPGWGLHDGDKLVGDLPQPKGWGRAGKGQVAMAGTGAHHRLPASLWSRLAARSERLERRLGHDHRDSFGSNSWAVAGAVSKDGDSLLAGDGHLSLAVPSLFYQIGFDTQVFGGGDTHQFGLVIPGLPILAVGTNGKVAWCQTQLFGDITDWYAEELQLDANGEPKASMFQGEWKPLQRVDETYVVADVPLLGSKGRSETWARWMTFDGRWIADIEGVDAAADTKPGAGESLVNLGGSWLVPGDTNGDKVVSAVSFDYTGLDDGNLLLAVDGFGHANDVEELRQATRSLVAYSQNIIASDSAGEILYTGYQAVPCRTYLGRNADGTWADGADPSQLLDGTVYGGFTIPIKDGVVDESQGDDPYRCVVPLAAYPQNKDPKSGYVLTANNDIGTISLDDSMTNDPWYIGGPWLEGYRADTIDQGLATLAAAKSADVAAMVTLQGEHTSRIGEQFVPFLLAAIDKARTLAETDGDKGVDDARLVALYEAITPTVLAEVEQRLGDWQKAKYLAESGVETFYNTVDAAERDAAVATMIFNAWFPRFLSGTFDDEGLPGVWQPTGGTGRMRALTRIAFGRGADNPNKLASFNAATGESAFFDILTTEAIERSDEIALLALQGAIDFLRSDPIEAGQGGFGSDDMATWLWGLRHMVKFESILLDFFGDNATFAALADQFAISTEALPLADKLEKGDPRKGLLWFPRWGDQYGVDAGNPGFSGTKFTYGSGPVFRMVISLQGDKVSGVNVIPGGESALVDSPHFADQAAKWLANEALPLRFHVDDVVAGATGREVYAPAP